MQQFGTHGIQFHVTPKINCNDRKNEEKNQPLAEITVRGFFLHIDSHTKDSSAISVALLIVKLIQR